MAEPAERPKMFFQGYEAGNPALVPREATIEEAQRLVDSGEIDETTLVWTAGMGQEWQALSAVLGNPPFASLDMDVRKPLGQMVQNCNDRWQITLPDSGPLSFAEEAHHLQWTSSSSEATPPTRAPPGRDSEGKRRAAPSPPALPEGAPASAGRIAAARTQLDLPTKEERTKLFERLDFNGNGGLSLAEIDKGVIEMFPAFNCKPALMRAYKAADRSGDGFIERREFRLLLQYLVYFNNLFHKFEEIDANHDGRLCLEEFVRGCSVVGVTVDRKEAEREFAKMDGNNGGYVLFDEFCVWCAHRESGASADGEDEPQAGKNVDWGMALQAQGVVFAAAPGAKQPRAEEVTTQADLALSPVHDTAGTPRKSAGTPPQRSVEQGHKVSEQVPPNMHRSPRQMGGSPAAKDALLEISLKSTHGPKQTRLPQQRPDEKRPQQRTLRRDTSPVEQHEQHQQPARVRQGQQRVEQEEGREALQWSVSEESRRVAARRTRERAAGQEKNFGERLHGSSAAGRHSRKVAEQRRKLKAQEEEEQQVWDSGQLARHLEALRQGKELEAVATSGVSPAVSRMDLEPMPGSGAVTASSAGGSRGSSPRQRSPRLPAAPRLHDTRVDGGGRGAATGRDTATLEELISEAASKLKTLSGEVYDSNSPESRAQLHSPRRNRRASQAASLSLSVCVCVCARVRACVLACVLYTNVPRSSSCNTSTQ